jgi:hypothetical protein
MEDPYTVKRRREQASETNALHFDKAVDNLVEC